jgi:tetratricopeptide (TPR) repeat protein
MGRKRQPHLQKKEPESRRSGIEFSRGLIIGAILVITFLGFANSIDNKFAYDDQTQILSNELIRDFSNLPTAFTKEVWFWRVLQDQDPNKEMGPTTPYYRPMFTVYLMVGWHLFGEWPQPWHLFNVFMHLIAVLFMFLILEKVTKDLRLTAIATILFAVHPLRVESVAWISGVTDLFLALFLLPSFYLYMLFREPGPLLRRIMYLSGSLALFLVAAFSKEPAVALPIFIVAYELLIINRGESLTKKIVMGTVFGLSFFAVSVVYFWMRFNALGFVFHHTPYTKHPFDAVIYTIPLVICKYLALLIWPFWPVKLSLFHATYLVRSPLSLKFILPLVAILALAFALWKLRNSSVARFAALWFAIHLLPVLNLSAFAEDFMVQERYVYIPSIGFSLLLAMGLVNFPYEKLTSWYSRKQLATAVVVILALAMTVTTMIQNNVWEDDLTLWDYGVKAAPDQTMPHFVLGHKNISRNQPMEVVKNLENYMKLDPENVIVISNLAAAHLFAYEITNDRSHIDRSIALSEKGLKLTDKYAPLWDTLGRAYTFNTDIKNYPRAHYFFDQALRLQPENAMINFHKGATYALEQKLDPAMQYLETARRLEPDLPDVYKFMGYVYRARKQNQEAINSFNTYLRMVPGGLEDKEVRKVIEELQTQARNDAAKS